MYCGRRVIWQAVQRPPDGFRHHHSVALLANAVVGGERWRGEAWLATCGALLLEV